MELIRPTGSREGHDEVAVKKRSELEQLVVDESITTTLTTTAIVVTRYLDACDPV